MKPLTIDKLLAQLNSLNPQQRQSAAITLSRVQDERAVQPLLNALRDPDSIVRANAAAGLGTNAAPEASEPLMALLHDADAGVRGNAAWALGELADETLLPALLPLLNDPTPEVRGKTCWALGNVGELTGTTALVEPLLALLDDYAEIPNSSAHLFVCQYAAEALLQIGTDTAKQAVAGWKPIARDKLLPRRIQDLIRAFQHKDPETRVEASRQLLEIGAVALDSLLEALQTHDNARVRQGVVQTLGRMNDNRAVQPLINTLTDSDPGVWSQATAALATLGEVSEKALRPALNSKEQRIRQGAALALWRIKREEKAFSILLQALQDAEILVRSSAINSLWIQPDARAVATLQIQLQHEADITNRLTQ